MECIHFLCILRTTMDILMYIRMESMSLGNSQNKKLKTVRKRIEKGLIHIVYN